MRTDLAYAQSLDAADPLAHFRDHFAHPDAGLVYVDGNSLGRMPQASLALANDLVTRQWGDRLIRSWNEGWFDAPERSRRQDRRPPRRTARRGDRGRLHLGQLLQTAGRRSAQRPPG